MPRRPADVMIQFTVSREERAIVQGRAAAKRLKLSQYIRLALNTFAFEEDEDAALLEERGIGRPRLTSRTPPRPAAHIKERKALAMSLLGRGVRWAHDTSQQPPLMLVLMVTPDGLVTVSGFSGEFAPHLFRLEVVE